MKSYSSREVIRILIQYGWRLKGCVGSHHQFEHPDFPTKVTIKHPHKDIPLPTLKSIEKQSGIKFI